MAERFDLILSLLEGRMAHSSLEASHRKKLVKRRRYRWINPCADLH